MKPPPSLILLAGPNGAGKTTAAPALLQGALGVDEFVNADTIAQGLSGFHAESAAMEAGRVMLRHIRELARRGVSFAFETTLASRSFAPWIRGLIREGYSFHLLSLWLPSEHSAVRRVEYRASSGGHDVPEATIRRRYHAGLHNFFDLYQPISTSWVFYDNSGSGGPRIVARGLKDKTPVILDPKLWNTVGGSHGLP